MLLHIVKEENVLFRMKKLENGDLEDIKTPIYYM